MKAAASIFLTLFVLLVAAWMKMPVDSMTFLGWMAFGGAIALSGYVGFSCALTVLGCRY